MRHGHGTTSNTPQERARRRVQPAREMAKAESNRKRAMRGGQPNELGVTQGQNGEQGNTTNRRNAYDLGKVRH